MWRSAVQVCLGLQGKLFLKHGGLAQLARALAWHARGHRFDPDILHIVNEKGKTKREKSNGFFTFNFSLYIGL